MEKQNIRVGRIPAIIWGRKSDRVFLHVHGKLSKKEYAEQFAAIAEKKGFQTVSFDLPQHGERSCDESPEEKIWVFNVFNALTDLRQMAEYVYARWKAVSLFGNSYGAQISLQLFSEEKRKLDQVLFQSPIVDMNYLISQMQVWFDVSEERLRKEKIVETAVDTMTIEQFDWFRAHKIKNWEHKTSVLYGGKDQMQSREVIENFCKKYGANLTVSEKSDHPFMAPEAFAVFGHWLEKTIEP